MELITLMIISVAVPMMPNNSPILEYNEERYHTANGTLDDTSTSTLLYTASNTLSKDL